MPFTIERLPDEPIILVKFYGDIVPDETRQVFERSAEIMEEIDGPVWRVSDFSQMNIPDSVFVGTLEAAKMARESKPGSTTDPRLTVIFVSRNYGTQLFKEFMAQPQFGGVPIPIFFELDEALLAARIQIETHREKQKDQEL